MRRKYIKAEDIIRHEKRDAREVMIKIKKYMNNKIKRK